MVQSNTTQLKVQAINKENEYTSTQEYTWGRRKRSATKRTGNNACNFRRKYECRFDNCMTMNVGWKCKEKAGTLKYVYIGDTVDTMKNRLCNHLTSFFDINWTSSGSLNKIEGSIRRTCPLLKMLHHRMEHRGYVTYV